MATCAQAIKEVFKSKNQILTTKQIIDAVQSKYPEKWKEVTIRTHTMGCSVNHTSSKWYPSFPKYLYTVGPGKVRLYDPEKDGEFELENTNDLGLTTGSDEDSVNTEEIINATLSLERDLQEYISRDLSRLGGGLKLYTGEGLTGREISTEAGKIDILAVDTKNTLVVIELKANKASPNALGQILGYMASIKKELEADTVRGIIVAEDFDKKLQLAVTQVSNISLIKFKVKFDFEPI
jgi:endonuclease